MYISAKRADAAWLNLSVLSIALFLITVLLLPVLSSCDSNTRNPLPAQYSGKARIPGMPVVRDFGGRHSAYYQKDFEQSLEQYASANPGALRPETPR